VRRWGVHKKLGGDTARTGDPTEQRGIPYRRTSCSAYKAGGRRWKGETIGVTAFVFPSNHCA